MRNAYVDINEKVVRILNEMLIIGAGLKSNLT
jgi:hypothetical protein